MREALNGLADAILAAVVLALSLQVLRGWLQERRAARHTGAAREEAEEHAKTFYALAAVQRPSVFLGAIAGSVLKIAILGWIACDALRHAAPATP